jgi:hypothetical protein
LSLTEEEDEENMSNNRALPTTTAVKNEFQVSSVATKWLITSHVNVDDRVQNFLS